MFFVSYFWLFGELEKVFRILEGFIGLFLFLFLKVGLLLELVDFYLFFCVGYWVGEEVDRRLMLDLNEIVFLVFVLYVLIMIVDMVGIGWN